MGFIKNQIKKFRENGMNACPKCMSYNIEMTYSEHIDNGYYTQNRCWDCGVYWIENYSLSNIQEMDVKGNIIESSSDSCSSEDSIQKRLKSID